MRNRLPAARRRLLGLDVVAHEQPAAEAIATIERPGEFAELFSEHDGRTVNKWMHYFAAYEREFAPYREGIVTGTERRPVRFLEIGTQHGGSLQMWRRYFGPDAVIFGVDVDPRCAAIDDSDLEVRIGSQNDPDFLRRVVDEMGGVDIVLDDGSHVAEHQRTSFLTLFPLLSDGGLYAAEDLHTAYWRDYGGGYQSRKSFVELSKLLVDDMNGAYHRRRNKVGVDAQQWVPRVAFYDSMVFISKARRATPVTSRRGSHSF